jgi:hypothetical protein
MQKETLQFQQQFSEQILRNVYLIRFAVPRTSHKQSLYRQQHDQEKNLSCHFFFLESTFFLISAAV